MPMHSVYYCNLECSLLQKDMSEVLPRLRSSDLAQPSWWRVWECTEAMWDAYCWLRQGAHTHERLRLTRVMAPRTRLISSTCRRTQSTLTSHHQPYWKVASAPLRICQDIGTQGKSCENSQVNGRKVWLVMPWQQSLAALSCGTAAAESCMLLQGSACGNWDASWQLGACELKVLSTLPAPARAQNLSALLAGLQHNGKELYLGCVVYSRMSDILQHDMLLPHI